MRSQDSVLKAARGATNEEKFYNTWLQMQIHVNGVIDSDLDRMSQEKLPGIKQVRPLRRHVSNTLENLAAL